MTTVARRIFASSPKRDANETWAAIVTLLTRDKDGVARDELLRVTGIVASTIADQAPKDDPMIVTCDGPRTRIYCIYDDDAIEGSDANEEGLGFDPLNGNWRISLPCTNEDLQWVQEALNKNSSRITARGPNDDISKAEGTKHAYSHRITFDPKGFLGS